MLHAYIISQNEQLSGKVLAVSCVCIKSLETGDYPCRAPHFLLPFMVDKERKTIQLKAVFYKLKMQYWDRN